MGGFARWHVSALALHALHATLCSNEDRAITSLSQQLIDQSIVFCPTFQLGLELLQLVIQPVIVLPWARKILDCLKQVPFEWVKFPIK